MLIDFNEIKEMTIPGMNNGTGTMTAKMFMFIADRIEKLRDEKHRLCLEDANNDSVKARIKELEEFLDGLSGETEAYDE